MTGNPEADAVYVGSLLATLYRSQSGIYDTKLGLVIGNNALEGLSSFLDIDLPRLEEGSPLINLDSWAFLIPAAAGLELSLVSKITSEQAALPF